MEVEFRTTKADYQAFYKYYFFRWNSGFRIPYVLFLALLFGAIWGAGEPFHIADFFLHTLIALPLIALLHFVVPYARAIIMLKRLVKAKGVTERSIKINLTVDGMSVLSPGASPEVECWRWESVRTADSGGGFVYIVLYHRVIYLIPRHYFLSDNEADNFVGVIKNGIEKVRGSGVLSRKARAKKLYWWGLVGLVPNFGVIAGLILFFKGIFQYKDRGLVIIGVADVLLTVLFWWAFHMWAGNSGVATQLKMKLTRDQLNNVFRNVEFYKLQHGTYPDSLKQIEKVDAYIWIDDPLQSHSGGKRANFFYQKVRDKYWLFSVGLDGKPFTKDDIYPRIELADTAKFGLLLR